MTREPRTPFERHRSHGVVLDATPRRRGRRWSVALVAVVLVAGGVTVAAVVGSPEPVDERPPTLEFVDPVDVHDGPLTAPVALAAEGIDPADAMIVELAVRAAADAATVVVAADCDAVDDGRTLEVAPQSGLRAQLVVSGDEACVTSTGEVRADVEVDIVAVLTGDERVAPGVQPVSAELVSSWAAGGERPAAAGVTVLDEPVVAADSRPGAVTFDGAYAATGLRPGGSTWQIPLDRAQVDRSSDGARAALVQVTAEGDAPARLAVHAPTAGVDTGDLLRHSGSVAASSTTAIVPLDESGRLCVSTDASTHVAVEVLAWFDQAVLPATTTTAVAPSDQPIDEPGGEADFSCPAQELFPHWLMIAAYGTDRSARLGVLGEQDPAAAATRLAEIAEPWRAGERPVLPAFELIATMATADPGRDGMHRLVSSPEFVQRYLDVARQHGFYLIIDIQPGYSDFLTEARRYEEFLREPDVGLALDPEWRTTPPQPPGGGHVGTVDAAEVNAVAEWLSTLVAEEDLPEKLLVVHQFQPRMLTRREMLVEPPGVALVVHMDGFGTRGNKQATYSEVRVDPPWDNGLKLFYDEDVEMYRADEVLAGAFDPTPVLITYQ